MFGEPALAHIAERAGVHPTWNPYSEDDHNRDHHDDGADHQQHIALDVAAPPPFHYCSGQTHSPLFSIAQRSGETCSPGCGPKGPDWVALVA